MSLSKQERLRILLSYSLIRSLTSKLSAAFFKCNNSFVSRYETPAEGKPFKIIADHVNERDDVTYIEDSMGVHEMKNETANQAISLHLYIPPFNMCHHYDRETAEKNVLPLTFTSTFGVLDAAAEKLNDP